MNSIPEALHAQEKWIETTHKRIPVLPCCSAAKPFHHSVIAQPCWRAGPGTTKRLCLWPTGDLFCPSQHVKQHSHRSEDYFCGK